MHYCWFAVLSDHWDTTMYFQIFQSFEVAGRQLATVQAGLSISNSTARQLFVYTKNSSRKCYVIWRGGCQIRPRLQLCTRSVVCWGRQNLGCVALAVSFSGFHSSRRLNCCTDWTVMLISSLLWGICSSLDSGLLATAIEVSKSRHNSTTKLLIQNPPISFQDNAVLSLHSTFQSLIFSDGGENPNSYLMEWPTHSLTHTTTTVCLQGSAHQGIINFSGIPASIMHVVAVARRLWLVILSVLIPASLNMFFNILLRVLWSITRA